MTDTVPQVRYWAPSQRDINNWDEALSFGVGKAFILENKGTRPMGASSRHRIRIDTDQLLRYIFNFPVPVFYVLPSPPWPASKLLQALSPVAPVPQVAHCRTGCTAKGCPGGRGPHGAFPAWTTVISALDLARFIGPYWFAYGQREKYLRADDLLVQAQQTALGADTLERFLKGALACTHGGEPHSSFLGASQSWNVRRQRYLDENADLLGSPHVREIIGSGSVIGSTPRRSGLLAAFVPVP